LNNADWRPSLGRVGQLDDVGHADRPRQAVVAQRSPLGIEPPDGVGHAPLDRHGQVPAVHGQPVADQLGRLVGPLQGAGDDRPAVGPAGGDVLRRHDDRGRSHAHVLPQVVDETDLLATVTGNELRVAGRHTVNEADKAGVAIDGALVVRVLPHHVGGGQQEQIRLRVTLVGLAPLMGGDAPPGGTHGRGEVRPHRVLAGPRELGHRSCLLSALSMNVGGPGQGTRRTGSLPI
jgi:hypothetical protein